MPAAIPLAVSLAATAAEVSATVAGLAGLAAAAVVGSYTQRQAKKEAQSQFNHAQVDRMANVVTTVAPRELVLGRATKGGVLHFRGSAGAQKETFLFQMALAGHEIDAVEAVYLNDTPVTLDADGYVQTAPYRQSKKVSVSQGVTASVGAPLPAGTTITLAHTPLANTISAHGGGVTEADPAFSVSISVAGTTVTLLEDVKAVFYITYQYIAFSYFARIRWDLGAGTAVADARTKELFPTLWTDDHRGQGVAKLIAEFTYNETAFPSGMVGVTVKVRGAKVYDPRSDTTAWSDNPALLMRHVYQHPYFGQATVSEDEDLRFIAAANACDTSHDYVVDGDTDTQKLYRAGLVAQYGTTAADIFEPLSQAMAGNWVHAGGELHLQAGVYTAPVMTLTEADLAVVQRRGESVAQDPISITVHRERTEKFNVVNLRIWDEEQGYKQVGLAPVKSDTLITRDGGELPKEVPLDAVSYAPQAQHVAGVMMRDARDPLTVEAPFKMRAYPLEIFDAVQLTIARYGWNEKTFLILGRVWDAERGVIRLTLKETSAAIYTPDAEFLPQGYAENTALPNPWDIAPPVLTEEGIFSGSDELVALADGTILTRVRVTWEPLTDRTVTANGQVELQWQLLGEDGWQSVSVAGDSSEGYIIGARDGAAIVIQARSKNSVAVSDWSDQVVHVVIGKTDDPPPVDHFKLIEQPGGIKQFFWTMSDVPPDLQSFLVRYSLGTIERPWDEMITLFAKGKNAREYETTDPKLSDTYTFGIRTVDTTGNMSEIVYITEVLDGDAFGTVERIVLPHELGWPGTKTDCFVSGALLVDAGGQTWDDFDVAWFSTDTWSASGSVSPIVYEHTTIDMESIGTFVVRANSLASGASTIEFAVSDDDVTYTDWALVPNAPIDGRYFKFRWTVAGVVPILYRAQVIFYV